MTAAEVPRPGSVQSSYDEILRRIRAASARSGRDPGAVSVVGAAKRQPVEKLEAAWRAGLRIFGENRVQEAQRKRLELPPDSVWHLIGPLQSNKVRKAVALFEAVHSIDRLKIGRALDREARRIGKSLAGLIEVNLGGEESKHGFRPDDLPEQIGALADLEGLRVMGLMAIPPWETDPERSRLWFRKLRELRDELFARAEWSGRPGWLSMGMSGDFEVAVEEGATHVRVGTRLFGPRPPQRSEGSEENTSG